MVFKKNYQAAIGAEFRAEDVSLDPNAFGENTVKSANHILDIVERGINNAAVLSMDDPIAKEAMVYLEENKLLEAFYDASLPVVDMVTKSVYLLDGTRPADRVQTTSAGQTVDMETENAYVLDGTRPADRVQTIGAVHGQVVLQAEIPNVMQCNNSDGDIGVIYDFSMVSELQVPAAQDVDDTNDLKIVHEDLIGPDDFEPEIVF